MTSELVSPSQGRLVLNEGYWQVHDVGGGTLYNDSEVHNAIVDLDDFIRIGTDKDGVLILFASEEYANSWVKIPASAWGNLNTILAPANLRLDRIGGAYRLSTQAPDMYSSIYVNKKQFSGSMDMHEKDVISTTHCRIVFSSAALYVNNLTTSLKPITYSPAPTPKPTPAPAPKPVEEIDFDDISVLLSDTERCWLYEINQKQCEMHLRTSRDELARYFLPEEREIRIKTVSYARQQEMACTLLGCDTPEWRLGSRGKKPPEEDPPFYLHYKESDYLGKYKSYSLYFSLCRLLGVRHIYDIGCEAINQSFLLLDDSELSYTGMGLSFALNDWREDDIENKSFAHPFVRTAPPPLCDGRIRFVKGWYPDTAFDVQPSHIAIASCSLTMCKGKEAIDKATAALTRDFERILFNPPFFRSEDHECWIQADWSGFTIRHFGYYGYLFATKIPGDLQKIQELYPIDDDGVIGAGLADIGFKILPDTFLTDWVRD